MSACWCRARPLQNSRCSIFSPGSRRARAPDPGYRHRFGCDRAGMRRGLSRARKWMPSISPRPHCRWSRRNVRRLSLQKARQRAAIGSFRRRGGLPLRYHREQSALCRARGNAQLAARVPARAAAAALPRVPTAWIRCGRFSPRRGGTLADDGILVVEVGNTEERAAARLSRAAVRLAADRRWAAAGYSCCVQRIWTRRRQGAV